MRHFGDDLPSVHSTDGLVQGFSNSSALAMELLQSCAEKSIQYNKNVLCGPSFFGSGIRSTEINIMDLEFYTVRFWWF